MCFSVVTQASLRPPPLAQTIENTREKDETMVGADDEEVAADEEQDEFSGAAEHGGASGFSECCKLDLHLTPLPSPLHLCSFWCHPVLGAQPHAPPPLVHLRFLGCHTILCALVHPSPFPLPHPMFDPHALPAEHFARVRPPKVLITTCYKPSKVMYTFLSEMLVSAGGLKSPAAAVLACSWRCRQQRPRVWCPGVPYWASHQESQPSAACHAAVLLVPEW